ncbi:MAG TPA: MBL fold metallo-hydrolase [Candidatus Acidoferrales bacterium]|nr:MBL fold metallo-hydrolase [Candidatus Acidoferrales bacterium]
MKLTLLITLGALIASAQNNPVLGEDAVKVSEHVWAIMGWPNIGIVVGSTATLAVDTGLGPRNGATIARVVAKLAPGNKKLYLTTTHFHPEHAGGDAGFPASTILIRDAVQQKEMEAHGQEMIAMFAGRSPQQKELLTGATLRTPDITFDNEAALDLGGVTARLFWFGGAHTKGDELTFVEPDRTLISGDVVQNKVVPNIFGDGGTPASWLAVLDKVAALNVLHVLPDHSAPGDGSMVALEKKFISDLRGRALELKQQGVTVDDAGKQLGTEFKAKYADWPSMNVAGFVRSVYAER